MPNWIVQSVRDREKGTLDKHHTIMSNTTTNPNLLTHPTIDDESTYRIVEAGQETTGRWTKDEHAAFMKGLERYGKEWRKVAAAVKTRTVMQTRTHAQKYFEKLEATLAKMNGETTTGTSASGGTAGKKRTKLSTSTARMVRPKIVAVPGSYAGGPSFATAEGGGGGGTANNNNSTTAEVPSLQTVPFSDRDIFLPVTEATANRPANLEYVDLLKANCVIFHSLPSDQQLWFVRNLCHFMTAVRGRRWIGVHTFGYNNTNNANSGVSPQYQLFEPSPPVHIVATEFRIDAVKTASLVCHPLWLIGRYHNSQSKKGENDGTDDANKDEDVHKGRPFCHRQEDGSWKQVGPEELVEVLKGEGPKNVLVLPQSIDLSKPMAAITNDDNTAEEERIAADAATVDLAAVAATMLGAPDAPDGNSGGDVGGGGEEDGTEQTGDTITNTAATSTDTTTSAVGLAAAMMENAATNLEDAVNNNGNSHGGEANDNHQVDKMVTQAAISAQEVAETTEAVITDFIAEQQQAGASLNKNDEAISIAAAATTTESTTVPADTMEESKSEEQPEPPRRSKRTNF